MKQERLGIVLIFPPQSSNIKRTKIHCSSSAFASMEWYIMSSNDMDSHSPSAVLARWNMLLCCSHTLDSVARWDVTFSVGRPVVYKNNFAIVAVISSTTFVCNPPVFSSYVLLGNSWCSRSCRQCRGGDINAPTPSSMQTSMWRSHAHQWKMNVMDRECPKSLWIRRW